MRWLIALVFIPAASFAADPVANCEKPATTYDFNICGSKDVEKAEAELARYLEAAKARMAKEEPEAVKAIDDAHAKWQEYKSKHCEAVYLRWQQGTIRGPKSARCNLDLTRQRTHRIWSDFLTYPDSTPPILPEPKA
jgi:uncharacterized protein YecT (DUF1311 family)